jgi:predicted transcriptional regulator
MARPRHEHPTPSELEVLKTLWVHGPLTVRDVMQSLRARRPRAYTSVMSLLNVMADKGLVKRKAHGRAYVYSAKVDRQQTLGEMVNDLMGRAFEGSASALVAHLLENTTPSTEELDLIRQAIETYQKEHGESDVF